MNYWLNEFQHELQLLIDPIRSALLTIIIVIVLFWILCGIIGASINKYKGGGTGSLAFLPVYFSVHWVLH